LQEEEIASQKMKKLKILHVIPSLKKGGAERLVLDICTEFNNLKKEVEVRLLNFIDENEFAYLSNNINRVVVNAQVIPSISGRDKITISEYQEYIKKFNPDIIHSHLFEAEIVSREVIFPKVAYVTHLHDNMPQFMNLSPKIFFNKERFTNYYEKLKMLKNYRKCDNHFIAISKDTHDYFIKNLPGDLHRITLMPNAIDLERFTRKVPLNNFPDKEGIVRLVSTGGLVDKKNQIFLVDVINILNKKGIDVYLEILGEGPNRDKIQAKINKSGLQDRITLKGNINNVEDYMHKAHIYVHPATYEPFGLVLLEAMAAGLPCVALDGRGNRDITIDGENGFLVKEPSPALFADRITQLINDRDLYLKISNNAIDSSKQYDIKVYVEKLLDYYNTILSF